MIKRYSDLINITSFEERFHYLKLSGSVGHLTFGFDRYLNQEFYSSLEWKRARRDVIVRDQGCDLGIFGYEIASDLLVHHMNPITSEDIMHNDDSLFDPEFLITTSHQTHNAIHYGNANLLRKPLVKRASGDTKLW